MEKNDIFTAVMNGVTSEGHGVCRHEGRAVFVPGALMGEEWEVRVVKCAANAVWGRGEKRLSDSPERVIPDCSAAGRCGGCTLQHMSYEAELSFKKQRVNEAFRRIGGLDFAIDRIIGAGDNARQRCKAIFNVGLDRAGQPIAGFYRPRSHEIVSAPDCALVRPEALRACNAVLRWMKAEHYGVYDELRHKQGMRHIFVRSSLATGKAVVTLISSRDITDAAKLTELLREAVPEMTGLVWCLNRKPGNVVLAGDFRTLWGSDILTEELCGIPFELSPRSFFQVNPPQAEKLYNAAVSYALEKNPGLVMDLYCGTGTIGLCMAKGGAQRVIGVEVIEQAVENARKNAARLGFENTEFLCGDAGEAAAELSRRGEKPDTVVVDPPRKGLDSAVIDCIAEMQPERVVYVSCDPGTLARDLALFVKKGYIPQEGLAVDMFPRTSHVESVVCLSRKNTHEMKLHASPFEKIRSGEKTIELRLFDEKRQKIKAGDTIIFTNAVNGETMHTTVSKLYQFESFEELYETLPLLQCGYTADDIDTAHPSDMEQYYSAEDQKKYGVVGIELFPPEKITDANVVCSSGENVCG